MFGVIIASRLVQTDFQRVGETQFLFNIIDADSINHIVVFMTGTEPFPEGMGGSVFFSWPDANAPPSWLYLGHISNTKPSAIFKISKLKPGQTSTHPFGVQQITHDAQIGIAVDQLSQISLQTPVVATSPSQVDSFTEFATKMLENFYNYVASFATQAPGVSDQLVPINCLHQWYQNFHRRLQQNPFFWR
uniref:Uncharacterized protein n=1 Tax=Strigamia maritima TaxID=126957 RepID=T1ITE7_STRMM